MRVSMIVLVVAYVLAGGLFVRSNLLPPARSAEWGRYQALAVALIGLAGLHGTIRPDNVWLRIAFALLLAGSVIRLAVIPRQVRRRAART